MSVAVLWPSGALDVGADDFDGDDPYDPTDFIDEDDEFDLRSGHRHRG